MEENRLQTPPYAKQTPESGSSEVAPANNSNILITSGGQSHNNKRPTTPEIRAPVVLLGRGASLLHSPSPSLLRKIQSSRTSPLESILVDPASSKNNDTKINVLTPRSNTEQVVTTTASPDSRTIFSAGTSSSSNNNSDSSRVVERSLIRKRPWEKKLPQLKTLQKEVNSLLVREKSNNATISNSSIFSASTSSGNLFPRKSNIKSSNINPEDWYSMWGSTTPYCDNGNRRRYPNKLLYREYSFTPHLHIDLVLWGDEIDDIIFKKIAEKITSDGGRATHLTVDGCHLLTDSHFATIFSDKGHFPRLEALSSRFCPWISATGLAAISARCDRLTRLTLDNCVNVDDASMAAIAANSFPTLQCLDVAGCSKITDRGAVAVVTSCAHLRELSLHGCVLVTNRTLEAMVVDTEAPGMIGTVTRPSELASHAPPKLERLSIAKCALITDDGLCPVVEIIKTLTHLDFSDCDRLTDKVAWSCMQSETLYGPRMNGGLPRLRFIGFGGCTQLTSMALSQLTAASFPLQTVKMQHCVNVDDQGCRALSNLVHLTDLDLSGCLQLTSRGLSYLGGGSCTRKMRTLRLIGMGERCFDEGFRAFVLRCRLLTFVDLSDNEDRISDGCIGGILTTCKRLTHVRFCNLSLPALFTMECVARTIGTEDASQILMHVNLSGCEQMDDDAIFDYIHEKRNSLAINLSNCQRITRKGIIGTPNWRLHTLGIANMAEGEVDDATIQELTYTHPDLTAIDLSGNPLVTPAAIDIIFENCKKIRTLNIAGCNGGIIGKSNHSVIGERGETKGDVINLVRESKMREALERVAAKKPYIDVVGYQVKETGDEMRADSITQPSSYSFFSDPTTLRDQNGRYTVQQSKFIGFRPTYASLSRHYRGNHWEKERKQIVSAIICQCAYRSYIARLKAVDLAWKRKMKKWFSSIRIQTLWRQYRDAKYASLFKWERTTAARLLQYVWRRSIERKKKRKAMLMWKNRALARSFHHWSMIAEQLIEQRVGEDERKWKKAADDFRRRQIMTQWVRPGFIKWQFWANATKVARVNARNAQARALSYFRNHNLVKCMAIWKGKIPERKQLRKHNAFIFMQAVSLKSHNTATQIEKYNRADAYLRYKARVIVMDILHQHVMNQRAAYEEAKKHAIMSFRNRWTMSAFRSWLHLRDWRRKHKADIKKGEEHWHAVKMRKAKIAIDLMMVKVLAARKRRADARRALKYWMKSQLSAAFKGWKVNVYEKIQNRKAMAKAVAYMQNRVVAAAMNQWSENVKIRIKIRKREAAQARRNEAIVRRAMARLRSKNVRQCFLTWVEATEYMQRFKVKFLMKWRRREIHYYFCHWVELMEEFWDLQEKGILEQARLDKNATQIQKIARGMLAKMEWIKEKHAVEWAARKMQGAYRIRLAQKILYKLWRHQYLKDYIVSTEEEFPKMLEEDRISRDLERWWKASTFIAWQWEAYKARKFMWGVRADSQRRKKEFEKIRMIQIMEEAERRKEARQVIEDRKWEVSIMLQRLWRGHLGKNRFHRRWLRNFYEKTMIVVQRNVRARIGRLRYLARSRWLVMRKKVWWERKKLAFVLRGLGFRKKQSQESFMASLAAFGFHPETFNLNPLIVVKQILLDIIVAKSAVTDQIKLFGAGGFNEKRRSRLYKIITKRRHARYTPIKGHAVKLIGKGTRRRGETGYVVRVDTTGRKLEKILTIKLDKDSKIIKSRYWSSGEGTDQSRPNLQIVCVRCARILRNAKYTCNRCCRKYRLEPEGFPIMNVQKVKENELKLRLEGERMGVIYRDIWAARLVQRAYRARLSKRKVRRLREKIQRNTKKWIWRYRKIFGCLGMRTQGWRYFFIDRKLIREHLLPAEYYPPHSCVPKWYTLRKIRIKEAKARELEVRQFFSMRNSRTKKAGRRTRLEIMPMRKWTKKQARRKRNGDFFRKYTRHKLANGIAGCTDGGLRRSCGSKLALGIAHIIGGKTWRMTEEDHKTWARFLQLECFKGSPHVIAEGWVMYHGMVDRKGLPHGRGMCSFPNGRGYTKDDIPRWDEKKWFVYSQIHGFFEHGVPVGDVIIIYKGGMRYEGLYNGEPPDQLTMSYKTASQKEAIDAITKARAKYEPEKTEEEKKIEKYATARGMTIEQYLKARSEGLVEQDEEEEKKEKDEEEKEETKEDDGSTKENADKIEAGDDNKEEQKEEEGDENVSDSDSINSLSEDEKSEDSGLSEHSSDIEVEEEEVDKAMAMTFSGMKPHNEKVRPWTPGPEIIPKLFRPSTAEIKVIQHQFKNRAQSSFKKNYNMDRFVHEDNRLDSPLADGQYPNYGYDNKKYDPANKRRFLSAYSADPSTSELLYLPNRHIPEHIYQSYARIGCEEAATDRVSVAVQDAAKQLWDLLPLNAHGKANVEDILHAISIDGAIFNRLQVVLGKMDEKEKVFELELAASNAEIFEDKKENENKREDENDGDDENDEDDENGEIEEEKEERPKTSDSSKRAKTADSQTSFQRRINDKKRKEAARIAKEKKEQLEEERRKQEKWLDTRGVTQLPKTQQFALSHPTAWLGVLATIGPAPEIQARSRTPSIAGSLSRPGSPFDLSNRPVSRQSVISFGQTVEIKIMPPLGEEKEHGSNGEKSDNAEKSSEEEDGIINNKKDSGSDEEEGHNEKNIDEKQEEKEIIFTAPKLATPRRPDENRVITQIEFEMIVVQLLGQMDSIELMYKALQDTAESARVTPNHITKQWTLDAKVRGKAAEIGKIELLGDPLQWPMILESTASEWDTVENINLCLSHNVDLYVFAKSVWEVHCGIHTVRTMFNTERIKKVSKKIKQMCPGASIEGWLPKKLREQQHSPTTLIALEDEQQKDESEDVMELTEKEEEKKREIENNYSLSVTVAEWFEALDGEYEIQRALDRELEGLTKKQVKKLLKKRKKNAKKEAKIRKKKKLGPKPLDMREKSSFHPTAQPLSNLEWCERRLTGYFPSHLRLTPFSLAFRTLSLLEDGERAQREADALRARTPGPKGRTFDDQWGKITLPNGEIYESYMVDNNFDPKGTDGKSGINGRYFVTIPTGEKYDGDMIVGMNHGYGRYYYKDGTVYEGQWFDGKKHGRGELRIFTGETYRGEWRSDKMHGYGVHTFTNGSEYEGRYEAGKWHGKGILMKANGMRYEGGFKKGKFHGWGRMHYVDGGKYVGDFVNGIRSGQGHYIPPKSHWNRKNMKEEYKGHWAHDVMHGEGVYYVDQPEGWVKVRDGIWVHGTLRDWTHIHYNDIATIRFCEMFAGRGALSAYAAAQIGGTDYQKSGFYTDGAKTRGAYSQFVAQQLPHLPPGVNPSDRRVRIIVREIVNQWLHSYGLIGRDMVAMDTLAVVKKQIAKVEPKVSEALEAWEEAKEEVLDEREALAEQQEVLEEEQEMADKLTNERDKLALRLQKFWIDEDENQIKSQWLKAAEKFQTDLVTKDFYNIRTVSKPNNVLKKLMFAACVMCYNTMADMNEKYGRTNQKTGAFIPWTDDEWRASKNLIMKSDDNAQNLDQSALINGPYDVKLWDEIRRFDIFKLSDDEERILELQELIFDPQIAAGSPFLQNISKAIPPLIHFIKLTVTYAVLTRRLVPVQKAYKVKSLELADVEEGLKFEKEELEEREGVLEEALQHRRKQKAIYRTTLEELRKHQKLYKKIIALRSGTEDYVTEDVPPVTPRPPPVPPEIPPEYPWSVLPHKKLVELVDEYCLIVNEKLLAPWMEAMVQSIEKAFDQEDTPPNSDAEGEEEEEPEPEARTDEVWIEIEEAFAVATLKKEEAEKKLAKAEKKGKEKNIKKATKELDRATKNLLKASKVLEKEAEKIPRLWKAEAAYEQVVTFLKLAEDEVKRLKKGAKIKKNKLKKAETEVKRLKKAMSKCKNELNKSKKAQKQWNIEQEEKRIAAEDTSVPNETIARRTMENIQIIQNLEEVKSVLNYICNSVAHCQNSKISSTYQEAYDRHMLQLAEEEKLAAQAFISPHPAPESQGRHVRLAINFLKVDSMAKDGPLTIGDIAELTEPFPGKGIIHRGRFHIETENGDHFYYKRKALMLIPLEEMEALRNQTEEKVVEDDGLERLSLEELMKRVDDMNSGITKDQMKKYGPLNKRSTWISILRSDGLQELTLAELKEKAGPLRLKKRQIEKFGPIDKKNTYILILRSDDPLGDIEKAGSGTISRPATAATNVTSSRPGTGIDSLANSEFSEGPQYPSLIDGDAGASIPEKLDYELIGFRIHHDNHTYETLKAESERADIQMVSEFDELSDAQTEVARLRAILKSVIRTPQDDLDDHHKTMENKKVDEEIKSEVSFVLESIVESMVRVEYNTLVRNYKNGIKNDIYWNKHRKEEELVEILRQETTVLDLNPWSIKSAQEALKEEFVGSAKRQRWREYTEEQNDYDENFALAKDDVIKMRRTLKRMAWNVSIYRRLNEETSKETKFEGAPQIIKGVPGYFGRFHGKVDRYMKKDVKDLLEVLNVQELKGMGETALVTALRRSDWDLDKAIFYAFANRENIIKEDKARVKNVAEVRKLRRLFYDIAQGPEPNPPKVNDLEAARAEVGRLRMLGRRLLWNQSLIDHLKAEVEFDAFEDIETEEILSVAQKVKTKGPYEDLSYQVSSTKDPGGGWAGEAVRAADCLERVADPAIEKLQEKVVKRRLDYAKAAKKLKKAEKKKKPKPIAKAQKEVDKVKKSLLKATELLEEKTNGITEEMVVAARKLKEEQGDEWDDYVEKAKTHHEWMFKERIKELRRLRVALARFKTSMWEFEKNTELETWLEETIEVEKEEERIAAEQAYWDSIGYYDENGNWKLHKKKKKKKNKKEKNKKEKKGSKKKKKKKKSK